MKQLAKEQHDTIVAWMKDKCDYMIQEFSKDFQPSCCDSCADGETCESDKIVTNGQPVVLKNNESWPTLPQNYVSK